MKLKRILACVAAASLAATTMSFVSFAEGEEEAAGPLKKVEPVVLYGGEGHEEPNMAQYDLSIIDAKTIETVVIKGKVPNDQGWFGGGGGFGYNITDAGEGKNPWTQIDFAIDSDFVTLDQTTGEVEINLDFATQNKDLPDASLQAPTVGEDGKLSTPIFQLGWWWGAGDTLEVTDIIVNGKSIMGVSALAASVGTTDFSHGGIETYEIAAVDPGTVRLAEDGKYLLEVVDSNADVNLLGDAVADIDNAKALGIRFKVSNFRIGDPELTVSANTYALTKDAEPLYKYSEDDVKGVTVSAGNYPVATVTGNGEYIVWVVYDEPIVYDEYFTLGLVGSLAEAAPATIAADDAALPYDIEVLSVGVQEPDADVTPVEPDEPSTSEPTPEDPGTPPAEESSDDQTSGEEPTTSGDDTQSGDNSGDDNGNTSVDNGDDNNPGTGVALAVVPAVLAAGALATATIVLKKRK